MFMTLFGANFIHTTRLADMSPLFFALFIFGVKGNHPEISVGGHLVRDLIASESMILVNGLPLASGGPFTRFDPSDPENEGKKSCLDLVLVSPNLVKYLKVMRIDSQQKLKMARVTSTQDGVKMTSTDHYTVEVIFQNIPLKSGSPVEEKVVRWNLNKIGGWERYEMLSDKAADKIVEVVEDEENDIEKTAEKVEKIDTQVKIASFGKVKTKKQGGDRKLKKERM